MRANVVTDLVRGLPSPQHWMRPVHTGVSDDLDLLIDALAPGPGKRLLSISAHGGGEAALALAAHGADRVIAYDLGDAQLLRRLVDVKLNAARAFGREDYLAVMGLRPATRFRMKALVSALIRMLPAPERRFWTRRRAWLEGGLFHADLQAIWFRAFKVGLWLLAPEAARRQILTGPFRETRVQTFRRYVHRGWLKRALEPVGGRVNLFFPRAEWQMSEYPKRLSRDPLAYLEQLIEAGLGDNPLFAHHIFDRHVPIPEPLLPPHLRTKAYDGLRGALGRVRVMITAPGSRIPIHELAAPLHGAYLSNVVDYLGEEDRKILFSDLSSRLVPGAPVLVYSNESFAKEPVGESLALDEELTEQMAQKDRGRIYRRIALYRARGVPLEATTASMSMQAAHTPRLRVVS